MDSKTTVTPVCVELVDGQPSTTSLDVASHFGKRHDDVLKRIRALDCSPEFTLRNFAECSRAGANNKPEPYYRMTRDGFTFLCMGFTGKAAAKWKEAYINAFNQLERKALSQAALPAPEQYERITHAFRGSRVEFLVDGRQVWVKASCITTALGLGSSDRITRSLADDRKVYRMRGQQKHWFIDPAAAMRAAGYVRENEKAVAWEGWLAGVLKTFDGGVQKAALVEALVPGHTPVERYGLEQLLDTKFLFTLDEQGRAQVKPIPTGALIVTPERLADVLRDPFTVPVEYLPNLIQVIAGRMGAVLQNTLPSR